MEKINRKSPSKPYVLVRLIDSGLRANAGFGVWLNLVFQCINALLSDGISDEVTSRATCLCEWCGCWYQHGVVFFALAFAASVAMIRQRDRYLLWVCLVLLAVIMALAATFEFSGNVVELAIAGIAGTIAVLAIAGVMAGATAGVGAGARAAVAGVGAAIAGSATVASMFRSETIGTATAGIVGSMGSIFPLLGIYLSWRATRREESQFTFLRNVSLRLLCLEEAQFTAANLTEADFSAADLDHARFAASSKLTHCIPSTSKWRTT